MTRIARKLLKPCHLALKSTGTKKRVTQTLTLVPYAVNGSLSSKQPNQRITQENRLISKEKPGYIAGP